MLKKFFFNLWNSLCVRFKYKYFSFFLIIFLFFLIKDKVFRKSFSWSQFRDRKLIVLSILAVSYAIGIKSLINLNIYRQMANAPRIWTKWTNWRITTRGSNSHGRAEIKWLTRASCGHGGTSGTNSLASQYKYLQRSFPISPIPRSCFENNKHKHCLLIFKYCDIVESWLSVYKDHWEIL